MMTMMIITIIMMTMMTNLMIIMATPAKCHDNILERETARETGGIVNKDDVRNTADELINIAVQSPKSIAVKVTEQLLKRKGLEIEVG